MKNNNLEDLILEAQRDITIKYLSLLKYMKPEKRSYLKSKIRGFLAEEMREAYVEGLRTKALKAVKEVNI